MSGRFKACEYPYCSNQAADIIRPPCQHKLCQAHQKHNCKKIDAWQKSAPMLNGLKEEALAALIAREGRRKRPKVSNKEWTKIIER